MITLRKTTSLFLLLGICLLVAYSRRQTELQASTLSPLVVPYPGPSFGQSQSIEEEIALYEMWLEQDNLSSEQRASVESLLQEARQIATMLAAPTPSGTEIALAQSVMATAIASYTPAATLTPQLGIIESGHLFVAHPPQRVAIENIWQGYINGNLTVVYAGRLKPDYRSEANPVYTQHGTVYVMIYQSDGRVITGLYPTEKETGALHIVQESNKRLILQAGGYGEIVAGALYYFDIPGLQYVASMEALAPTVTPWPTTTPVSVPNLNPYP